MRIKNINDMCEQSCRCGSWLEHWKNHSKQPFPNVCPAKGCEQVPVAGAFVQKDNYFNTDWYIVPLCHKHNRLYGASLDLSDSVALVLGKAFKDCGQPLAEAPAQADRPSDAEAVH
jgi:hypothetical protein